MTARDVLLAWAESGGFAAVHGGGASNEAIVDDLLAYLAREGRVIVPREPTDAMTLVRLDPEEAQYYWRLMIAEADK